MIFFAAGLSVIIFHSTDVIALGVVGLVWAIIMLLTGWPVLAVNNIHISSLLSKLVHTIRVARMRRIIARTPYPPSSSLFSDLVDTIRVARMMRREARTLYPLSRLFSDLAHTIRVSRTRRGREARTPLP